MDAVSNTSCDRPLGRRIELHSPHVRKGSAAPSSKRRNSGPGQPRLSAPTRQLALRVRKGAASRDFEADSVRVNNARRDPDAAEERPPPLARRHPDAGTGAERPGRESCPGPVIEGLGDGPCMRPHCNMPVTRYRYVRSEADAGRNPRQHPHWRPRRPGRSRSRPRADEPVRPEAEPAAPMHRRWAQRPARLASSESRTGGARRRRGSPRDGAPLRRRERQRRRPIRRSAAVRLAP